MKEEWGDNILVFFYDANGAPVGMQYRKSTYASGTWDTYLYEKNLQGDVIAVYNTSGTKLVSYTYDPWGRILGTTYHNGGANKSVVHNPFRYRGYYYDDDLDLYYLATRYYDPEVRRFVTADDPGYLGANGDLVSYNLFAYCSNNPVMYSDPTGHSVVLTILVGVGIGLVGQLAGDLITSAVEGELSFSHWSDYVGAAVGGGVSSLIPIGGDVLSSTVGSATATVVSALAYNIESAILGRDEFYSDEEIFYNVANNAMAGALFSFAFESSKIKSIFPDTKIPGTEHEWRDIVGALSVFGAVKNAMEIPSTHTWDSPNVERWYLFR